MSKRGVIWARKVHESLRANLGAKCEACGATELLEFDCIKPRGHKHHAAGYKARATFYRREHEAGNLGLLCLDCHNKKTRDDRYWLDDCIMGIRAERNPQGYLTSLRIYYPKRNL